MPGLDSVDVCLGRNHLVLPSCKWNLGFCTFVISQAHMVACQRLGKLCSYLWCLLTFEVGFQIGIACLICLQRHKSIINVSMSSFQPGILNQTIH